MRKLSLTLATLACVGLAVPAFANERALIGPNGPQISAGQSSKAFATEFSSQDKKKKAKKKKSTTGRSSWGG
jgi:hypothetical protein